jgi:simple sugar transport system permease protein
LPARIVQPRIEGHVLAECRLDAQGAGDEGGCQHVLGGAYIVVSQVFVFTEHMSAGKGFIALAAIILGRWDPIGALLASWFFGFCDALQLRLQFANPSVPYQIFTALPYVASILALIGLYGRVRPPSSVGLPYQRESKT